MTKKRGLYAVTSSGTNFASPVLAMSASVRPSIPRPRSSNVPPARSAPSVPAPAPVPARTRAETLDLEDHDIVGVALRPAASVPPPPPQRSAPPPVPKASAVPPAEDSGVALAGTSLRLPPPPRMPSEWLELADDADAATIPPPAVATSPMAIPAPTSTVPLVAVAAAPPVVPARAASLASASPADIPPPAESLLRLSQNDPTDVVFDGLYGLSFARSTTEAADVCASTLAKALRARTVIIHTHDLRTRELRAIAAHGEGDFDIVGLGELSDDDFVASAVICNQRAMTMRFDGELPRLAPKRLRIVGSVRTLVAAPALSWGRCLALIEVIDADDRFAARVVDVASYVAEEFARFLLAARAA